MIYLDHNSTTKLSHRTIEHMLEVWQLASNPSSSHALGRKARAIIEKARNNILDFFQTKKHKLVFTSSGTEANNLILSNFANTKILISSIEHPSIYEHSKYNRNIDFVEVDINGLINLDDLRNKLKASKYSLISVIYANNETGVIQNTKEIAKIAHEFKIMIHTDLTQAVGKIPIDLEDLGVDFATFSAHKFHGPVGCGGLLYRSDFHIKPQIFGGGQEMGIRSGTENLAAIVGTSCAIEEVSFDDHIKNLRDDLEAQIVNFAPDAKIFGQKVNRLPNTSMISMPNVNFNIQIMQLDLANIATSSGSACSSARITNSRILKAMNVEDEIAECAIRVSLGRDNTKEEIDQFIAIWKKLYQK